jgi:integrase
MMQPSSWGLSHNALSASGHLFGWSRSGVVCLERDRVILELLYGCGLRAAELCGLNIEFPR